MTKLKTPTAESPAPSHTRHNELQHESKIPPTVIDHSPSQSLAQETSISPALEDARATLNSISTSVTSSPETDTGAFPSFATSGIIKREEIRLRLREKERTLKRLMRDKQTSQQGCGNSSIEDEGSVGPSVGGSQIVTFGKEEADRREAIRVLSQSALQATLKLRAQRAEHLAAQNEVERLSRSLKECDEHKMLLDQELKEVRDEKKALQAHLAEMQRSFEEQKSILVCDLKSEGVVKNEQVQYIEYQLLARNQEIDDLKQELNARARRIVALEIDLEIHDDRFLSVMDDISKDGSADATLPTTDAENMPPREVVVDTNRNRRNDKHKRGLKGFMSWRKKKNETISLGAVSASEELSRPSTSDRTFIDFKKLKSRYRVERYQNSLQTSQLEQENKEYLIKIRTLERQLKAAGVPEDASPVHDETAHDDADCNNDSIFRPVASSGKTRFLQEKNDELEAVRGMQNRMIDDLRAEIEKMKEDTAKETSRTGHIVNHIRLECEVYDLKLVALQRELEEVTQMSESQSSIAGLYLKGVARLEAKLLDNLTEVVRLRKALDIKDQKNTELRSKVIDLRYSRMLHEKAAIGAAPVEDSLSGEHPADSSRSTESSAKAASAKLTM